MGLEPARRNLEPTGRGFELAERASEMAERASDPAGRAYEPPGWSPLIEFRSYLEESWTIWKGPGVSCEGLKARWEPRERRAETDRDRETERSIPGM